MSYKEMKKKLLEDVELTKEILKARKIIPVSQTKEMVSKIGESLKEQASWLKNNKENVSDEEVKTLSANMIRLISFLAEIKTKTRVKRRSQNVEKAEDQKVYTN